MIISAPILSVWLASLKCKWVMTGRPCVFPCMTPERRLLVSGMHAINQAICEQVHNRERSKRAEEGQDAK